MRRTTLLTRGFVCTRHIKRLSFMRPLLPGNLGGFPLQPHRIWDTQSSLLMTGPPSDDDPILADLNPMQRKAVTQPLFAITRVLAGPGSGKTRVLTSRIAYLLQQDERARVLAVTFTRKAAGEMQHRLEKLLAVSEKGDSDIEQGTYGDVTETPFSPHLRRVNLGTFHSICAKILRWNGQFLSTLPSVIDDMSESGKPIVLDANFAIVDEGEQLRILRECLKECNMELSSEMRPQTVLKAISKYKNDVAMGKDPYPDKGGKRELEKIVLKIYSPYREKLLGNNAMDFDDLLVLTRELLLNNRDIRSALQNRWHHILIDEFQDTSRTQMDIAKLLTNRSLLIVGDADQSIYSWRGAHVDSLYDFENDFNHNPSGVDTIYLMENYRSTPNIVNAAQKIISSSFGNTQSSKSDKLRQDMKPKRDPGPSPRIIACKDDKAEAEFVVNSVKRKVDSREYTPKHSVAFIYRTNAQSRALEEACVKKNIPYVIFGAATTFYKRQEIKDCLCFLRWMYNGRDRSSMLRAFKTPSKGIGDGAIKEFDQYCAMVDGYYEEVLPDQSRPTPLDIFVSLSHGGDKAIVDGAPLPSEIISKRSLKSMVKFAGQMQSILETAHTKSVERVLTTIIDELALLNHFDKISKSKIEFEERQGNVRELQQAANRYTKAGPCLVKADVINEAGEVEQSPLGAFLDDISLVTDVMNNSTNSTEDRFVVSFMTIHASKGMEFDTVFIVGNEDGTFPTSQALNEELGSVAMDEEKRLCYVAMTRAKTELIMTWRKEVPVFSVADRSVRTVTKDRSRFLDLLVSKNPETGASKTPVGQVDQGTASIYSPSRNSSPFLSKQRSAPSLSPTRKMSSGTNQIYAKSRAPLPFRSEPRANTAPSGVTQKQATTALYSKDAPPFRSAPGFPTTSRPVRSPTKRKDEPSPTVPSPSPAPRLRNEPTEKVGRSQAKSPPIASREAMMDSTWFFPVGASVKHQRLGRGIVLPPSERMSVRVQFETGQTKDFPVHGSDLTPIL